MPQTISKSSQYIDIIFNKLSTVDFGSAGSLGSLNLIFKQDKAKIDHDTEIHIFRDYLKSVILDNATNVRTHVIVVSVICLAENREAQAQEDIYYLEEKILEIVEKGHDNINWLYLNNYDVSAKGRSYQSNYFYKDIAIQINEEVLTR